MSRKNLGCELTDLIHYLYRDTIAPELFELFGEDLALEFIQIFGGTMMKVPSYKRVLELQRNIEIYEALCYAYSSDTIKRLAQTYGVTEVWIKKLYSLMRHKYPKIYDFMKNIRDSKPVNVTTRRKVADKNVDNQAKEENSQGNQEGESGAGEAEGRIGGFSEGSESSLQRYEDEEIESFGSF